MAIVAFFCCCLFIGYVLILYPLLVAFLAHVAPRPTRKAFQPRSVSIVIPVHNGAAEIEAKLDSLQALDYPLHLVQTIVVSDGSTDETESLARRHPMPGLTVLSIAKSGKSTALNAGLEAATGEIVFLTDIRQKLSPNALHDLIECFADPSVGVVSGELIIIDETLAEEKDAGLYWRMEKWIRKNISRFSSVPGATGCIYAMRRSLVRRLPPHTLCDDMFLPLAAHLQGARIIFEDRAKAYDRPAALHVEFQRKVRTLAGVYQIVYRLPGLLNPAAPVFPHLVSHKVGRLLLPYALIGVLISSFAMPQPWNMVLLAGQAAFYLAAAFDPRIPQRHPVKRLSSPIRTFVALMIAALAATSILFVPAEKFWKPTRVRLTS